MKETTAGHRRDDVARLRREEEKLRARRVALLKARLERARAEVHHLEVELRHAGVSGEDLGGDRTNWHRIFDELPATLTVTQLHAATGANANPMSSVPNRWLEGARIKRVERGPYSRL